MQPVPESFLSASHYRAPVDRKKLRFVYSVIADHSSASGRKIDELEILEVACGVGGVTLPLATLGGRVRTFDIDDADLATMRERAAQQGLHNITSTREDALAFVDGRHYDVVVASEVFEHVTDPDALAANCVRHLAPDGVLVVTTPNGYGPWETVNSLRLSPRRWGWLRRLLRKPAHDGGGREHEQRYTRARLVSMFAAHAMTLRRAENSDFVLTVVPSLRAGRTSGTIDCTLAGIVPYWMASGWYMAFGRAAKEQGSG